MIANTSHQPVVIRNQSLTAATILPHHQHATSITLDHCTMSLWKQIGKALASLPQLETLILLHCDSGDVLCLELSNSKSLLRLRSGTCLCNTEHCGITKIGAKQIALIKQLEELVLGKAPDYSDEPAAKTQGVYETIFKRMRNLRKLEMPQHDLRELALCNR